MPNRVLTSLPTIFGFRTWLWARIGRKPLVVYYNFGGIGDELMLTAVAAAARAAGRPIHIIAAYPEVWRRNRDPASLQTGLARWHYAAMRNWIPTKVVHLSCKIGNLNHIAEQMAAHTGNKLPIGWRPVFFVPPVKSREPRLAVVQNSCSGARYAATTKEWPQDRWRQLTRRLSGDFRLVQIGIATDPPLPSVENRLGRTSLRDAAILLSRASVFIGLESGLQHLAAAVYTPSVIIYGGRSRPRDTGYLFNCNITRTPACVGCGLNTGCPHDLLCMDIPVTEVEAAVRKCANGNRL